MTSIEEKLHSDIWENKEILRSIVHQAPLGIIVIDLHGIVELWNNGAETIFGWKEEEVIGGFYPLFSGRGESKYRMAFRRVAQTRKITTFSETRRTRKDGSEVTVCINVIPLIEGDDRVTGIILLIEDLTYKKNSEKILKDTVNELENMKYSLDESSLLTITDPRGVIKYVNDHFCSLFQYSREELVGFDHRVINSKYHPKEFFKRMWSTLGNGKIFRGEIRNVAKDGTFIWVDATIVPFVNEKGRPYQYMSICKDITDKKKAEEELVFLAYHDELTGLSNKRNIRDIATKEIEKMQPFALFCIGLDRFKSINNLYGNNVGDFVLVEVANRLRELIPDSIIIGRKDGDKFILLSKEEQQERLSQLGNQILFEISRPFEINDNRIYITTSIGVCVYPHDGECFDELLKKAEHAMYAAKKERKSDLKFFDKRLEEETTRRIQLEKYLRDAIHENELTLFYQPRVDIYTQRITGMEALLRWNPRHLESVSPVEFIPIAEETGLIVQIGNWVLEHALIQTKEWHGLGYSNLKVSVNLSPIQLLEPDVDKHIIETIQRLNFPPNLLELEVTENSALENDTALFKKLHNLKNFGVQISIDDFGTGYSSLSYLRDYPINRLKIDRSFLQDIEKSGDSPIVRTIIAMAKSLGFHVTAEGIEIEEQIQYLKSHGCDELQGFYFSKPVGAGDFLSYLKENEKQTIHS